MDVIRALETLDCLLSLSLSLSFSFEFSLSSLQPFLSFPILAGGAIK